jgi:SAM-dependent methyltransferase
MDWAKAYNSGFTIKTKNPSKIVKLIYPKLSYHKLVLDIGSGEGRNSIFFAQNNFFVDAIDVVDFNINSKNLKFKKIDVTNFIFTKKYDIVILSRVIQYLDFLFLKKLFSNIYDNLSEGGFVGVSYSYKGGIRNISKYAVIKYSHEPKALKQLFLDVNFKKVYFRKGANRAKHMPYKTDIVSYDIILKK